MRKMMSDIVIVGGGAAGMFAAAIASELGSKVTLFERNKYLGRKLGITGKGRCNLTNNCSSKEVIENTPKNGRFLYSALDSFSPEDTMRFFERLGVRLKTERGGRVFPVSDKAAQVVSALRDYIVKQNVKIINQRVTDIEISDGSITAVNTEDLSVECKAVIIATGGLSYPATGSTGDGYKFAQKAGHTISEPVPSLVPLREAGNVCEKLQGLSLKNVQLKVFNSKNKLIFSDFGEMLFTHFGLSGPIILSASSHMRDFKNQKYYAKIDLKPALDEKKLDQRIVRDFEKYSNRDFENSLSDLLPRKMIPVVVELSGISPYQKVNSVTKEQRSKLVSLLKGFQVDILGPYSIESAIITSGGVNTKEVNPSTMESRLVSGLYFAGEVLDVDAYTGGFNLQIAWSTAYTAAISAAMKILSDNNM